MDPSSCHNHHICWSRFGKLAENLGYCCTLNGTLCVVFEPLNPYGMVPISTPNIYKVIDNLHMLWMGIWIHHHAIAITTTLVGPDLENRMKTLVMDAH